MESRGSTAQPCVRGPAGIYCDGQHEGVEHALLLVCRCCQVLLSSLLWLVNMRSPISFAALALALLQGADALNAAIQREFSLLADMGLNPDLDNLAASGSRFSPAVSTLESVAETITEEFVALKLDQFSNDKTTFNNRFWVAESGYKPGGPVFIYDVGEANAESSALFRLQDPTSFFKQIVDMYGGVGIVWEHRYCKFDPSALYLSVVANIPRREIHACYH
jgi:hypothetical protein